MIKEIRRSIVQLLFGQFRMNIGTSSPIRELPEKKLTEDDCRQLEAFFNSKVRFENGEVIWAEEDVQGFMDLHDRLLRRRK